MKSLNKFFQAIALSLFLSACVSPQTGDVGTQLATAEVNVQAAVRACARLLDERRISADDGIKCDSITKQAFGLIDAGRIAFKAGDISGATTALGATRALLVEAERIAKK